MKSLKLGSNLCYELKEKEDVHGWLYFRDQKSMQKIWKTAGSKEHFPLRAGKFSLRLTRTERSRQVHHSEDDYRDDP